MINNSTLVGRLTKDPEIRQTQSGSQCVNFTLAVNRDSAKDGQQDADFIQCVAWNKTAELIAQYLHKGSLAGIVGRIQTRSYENQQGSKVYVTEVFVQSVQFLDSKPQSAYNNKPYNKPPYTQTSPYQTQTQPQAMNYSTQSYSNNGTLDISADDLPF